MAPVSVTFTSLNWSDAQMVTLTGADDSDADGDQPYTIVTSNAVSADAPYGGMVVPDVSATNTDDETSVDDSDGDGVNDVIEDAVPNGGDANGDEIDDQVVRTAGRDVRHDDSSRVDHCACEIYAQRWSARR